MAKKGKRKFNSIDEMLSFLKSISNRNKKNFKKITAQLQKGEIKYQDELAAYERLYGKYK